MDGWPDVYRQVGDAVQKIGGSIVYYRGHAHADWILRPGLGRLLNANKVTADAEREIEEAFYNDFVTNGGDLIPRTNDSWDNLFLMQHHGLPTRLLDWTESFAVALFFALMGTAINPCVWILDPFALNLRTTKINQLLDVTDLEDSYDGCFLAKSTSFSSDVVAVRPRKHVRRVAQQLSGFTLHRDARTPLDALHNEVITSICIPPTAIAGAQEFLRLTGISEYTLYPDLDGLSRHLTRSILEDWDLISA